MIGRTWAWPRHARLLALVAAILATVVAPVAAQDVAEHAVELPLLAPDYLAAFDDGVLPGLRPIDESPEITGDDALDDRIRSRAEARGYARRPVAAAPLEAVAGVELQPVAAEAWRELRADARDDGIVLVLTSGHRSVDHQRRLFRGRLRGSSDDAIEKALRFAAPPGYSKHHSGYAVDVAMAGRGAPFHETAAFAWLAEDNYANARRHGWVPSYPVFGEHMGPDPESWEFVWVGTGNILCVADASARARSVGFCDLPGTAAADDVAWLERQGATVGCRPGRYCVDLPVTRGEIATMVWRLAGAPTVPASGRFVDVYGDDHFADAVEWMWREDLVTGTSATTFSPDRPLTGAELLALLVRLDAAAVGPAASSEGPTVPVVAPATSPIVTRGEVAAVLRWWAATDPAV